MPQVSRSLLLPYSTHEMYTLVNDVARYCEFLPFCIASEIIVASDHEMEARMAFSRLGAHELQLETINMGAVAHAVVDEVRKSDRRRAVEVTIESLPHAVGCLPLIQQVLHNLVENAFKFTQSRADARITIGARTEGGEVVYCVADNGVGFDAAYAHRLFGLFQRLHRAEEFEGTGVGLATVRRIAFNTLNLGVWAIHLRTCRPSNRFRRGSAQKRQTYDAKPDVSSPAC